MKTGTPIPFGKLKLGDCFTLETGGPVWIKVRGGFRPGRGGQLHITGRSVIVYYFDPANAAPAATMAA